VGNLHSKGTGDRNLFLTREFSPKSENLKKIKNPEKKRFRRFPVARSGKEKE
jgi:hypothetical protein